MSVKLLSAIRGVLFFWITSVVQKIVQFDSDYSVGDDASPFFLSRSEIPFPYTSMKKGYY